MYVEWRKRTRILSIDLFSSLASVFSQSETSEALTEICRVDPTFDVAQFLRIVQYDIIPNIFEVGIDKYSSEAKMNVSFFFLQSLARGELEILKDWCTEAVSDLWRLSVRFRWDLLRFIMFSFIQLRLPKHWIINII